MTVIKAELVDRQDLTPQEGVVLVHICQGDVDKVIARQLAISIKTVETHILHIYQKLQVRQASINARCAAVGVAVAKGMVRLSTTALCWALIAGALSLDDQTVVRHASRAPSVRIARTRQREA